MKIAMVTTWNVKCGIATYSKALSLEVSKLGHQVYIIRLPRYGQKTAEILENIVQRIPGDVDLIHVQHEYGLYQFLEGPFFNSLKTLGKPIVVTMHAVGNWSIDDTIKEAADIVIVHNQHCASLFGESLKANVKIIRHGVQVRDPMNMTQAKKILGIEPKIPVVGYVGFISIYKGLETLIRAMKQCNGLLLICGGYGQGGETYVRGLKELASREMGLRCQWLDFIPDNKLPLIYGAIDVVVYPSRYASESGALLMALGFGKPTLASNMKPFREKEEECQAVETFSSEQDLIAKITHYLVDEDYRRKMHENALKYAIVYCWEHIAEQHSQLYKDTANYTRTQPTIQGDS